MKIAIASDHHGVILKAHIVEFLKNRGFDVLDFGPNSELNVDYTDYAEKVGHSVVDSLADFGIVICGTGIGMSIACNKMRGVYCALCHNVYTASHARKHNNANVLALGAKFINDATALKMVDVFLSTDFEAGRHKLRIDKIKKLEEL